MHESLPSKLDASHTPTTEDSAIVEVSSSPVQDEDLQAINAMPVPEGTKLPPHVYQHLTFHATNSRDKLVGKAFHEAYSQGSRDQEDAVQDAFLAAMDISTRSDLEFQRSASSLNFLFKTLHHKIVDNAARNRTEVLFDDLSTVKDAVQPYDDTLFDILSKRELEQWFHTIENILPQQRRKLFAALLNNPDLDSQRLADNIKVSVAQARRVKHVVFSFIKQRLEERLTQEGYLSRYDSAVTFSAHAVHPGERAKLKEIKRLQAAAVNYIRSCQQAGKGEAVAVVPPYIGSWNIAAKAIRSFLKSNGGAHSPGESAAMMLYPHDHLLADFRRYISPLLGKEGELVTITSPQEIADRDPYSLATSYAVLFEDTAPVPSAVQAIHTALRAQTAFLLRLCTAHEPESQLSPHTYTLPDYEAAKGWFLHWEPQDSVRYLQEWRFATGEQLTEEKAEELASRGQGPTVRRLCRKIGSFIAVQAEAGYSWPDK